MSSLRWATQGHVAIITFSRPEVRNAVDRATALEMEQLLDRFEDDPHLTVGVLAAEGPVFSAGADLSLVVNERPYDSETERGGFCGLVRRARRKPLIAACDGPAVAGGAEIVLACDMIVASESAWFAFPEVQRGLIAGAGGIFRLARVLPRQLATELLLTGRRLTAARAYELGVVNLLTGPGQSREAAIELATEITAGAAVAIHETLGLLGATEFSSVDEAFSASGDARHRLEGTHDYAEGARAFLEKRAPIWRDSYPHGGRGQ